MGFKQLLLASVASVSLFPQVWAEDVTNKYLVNAGFDDESSWVTESLKSNTDPFAVAGWTVAETGAWGASAVFQLGSSALLNDGAVPATDEQGNAVGGVLGLSAGWGNARSYSQAVTLPAGIYIISYSAYNSNSGATAVKENRIGFISDAGTSYLSDITSFAYGKWTSGTISFELTEETSGVIKVGFFPADGGSGSSAKLFVDYIKIESYESKWAQAVVEAQAVLDANPEGASEAREKVESFIAKETGTDEDVESLNELVAEFKTAIEEYKAWQAAVVVAKAALDKRPNGAEELRAAVLEFASEETGNADDIKTLEELTETFRVAYLTEKADAAREAKEKYAYSYESVLNTDLTQWKESDFAVMSGKEHWSTTEATSYYEQSSAEWNQSSWSHKASQSVALPAGKYAMFIAARGSTESVSTMSVQVNDSEVQTVTLAAESNSGRGIATDGTSTFDEDATYVNDGKGQGWLYSFIEFEIPADGDVAVISFASSASSVHQWVSIANPMLYGDQPADMVTAIKTAKTDAAEGAQIFDLSGRKLNNLQKGINVVNGVKVLVR